MIKLIEAVDDDSPPTGQLPGDAQTTLNAVIQNITTEVNGYLSSIYPLPLAQTGTVSILQVTGVSTDGLGSVISLSVIETGNYFAAPNVNNTPAYLRYIDPLLNAQYFNWNQNAIPGYGFTCQQGTGLVLACTFGTQSFSDENGQVAQAAMLVGTPGITAGGKNYNVGDLQVLVGGQSFVPAKIREFTLNLICHELNRRRLAPEERNVFSEISKMNRKSLVAIGEGEEQLDGTFKRFFSPASVWGQRSVLWGANSL